MNNQNTLTLASMISLSLVGCANMQAHEAEIQPPKEEMQAWLSDKPVAARQLYEIVLVQGERNRVLNQARAGLASFELGEWKAAKASLSEAADRIEAIYADNPEAEAARSKFTKENIKDFKGEPYERAMALYYLGLVYMNEGDYENARASFKSGMLQDSMAKDKEFSQDFASLAYLEGWASRCDGAEGLAEEAFNEAQTHNSALQPPASDHNTLVIYESGKGPVKGTAGEYDEKLAIARSPQTVFPAGINISNGEDSAELVQAEDIFYQATTRGGRQADEILVAKADFKGSMETAGIAMATTGLAAMNTASFTGDSDMASAGAAMAVGGLVAGMISEATRPQADDRFWDNLPGEIHMTTLASDDSGDYDFNVGSAAKHVLGEPECRIVWAREVSALDVPKRAPNSSDKAQDI